ncbi:MAG: RsmB/NOP family class I SAM-dependent RNA methyltransferase [Rhodoferax sp.]|nr:RsmB/NOP family class I SAM-dependent RNA methyltransferase [Rhodoferax sp.]
MHPAPLLQACADLVALVLKFDHPADAVVARFFRDHRSLGPRERATLTQSVYAVLRKKQLFDHLAPSGSGAKARRLAILGFDAPRSFLDGALNDQEKAWLDACGQVDAAALMERHRHNLPDWLAQRLKDETGPDFWPLATSLNEPAPLDLRVNTLKGRRAEVRKALAAAGVAASDTPYSPWGLRVQGKPPLTRLDAYTAGAFEVQDEGSQLLALLVDAHRGEMVVDFCAGAGGKTLALGAAMRNTGRLYAFDTSAHRLDGLKPRLARSGLSNVHPVAISHERDDRIKRLAGKIDRVLVDAPCSGLGTLRRNPDLKWRQDASVVEQMAATQAAILASAARLLKPGGRLVYATCSLLRQENEDVADAFSAAHADFESLRADDTLTELKVDQVNSLCRQGLNGASYLRLWPHQHATDGFFAAIWRKKTS